LREKSLFYLFTKLSFRRASLFEFIEFMEIGDARVSTVGQKLDLQIDALKPFN